MRARRFGTILPSMLLLCALPAAAGRGAAELYLDRTAVKDLLAAALPEPWVIDVPGVGRATLRLCPPRRVEFRDGGIDLTLPLELVEAGWSTDLAVRLVPDIEPLTGQVRLMPESVEPEASLRFPIDLANWTKAFELPRRLAGFLPIRKDAGLEVGCFLQGMTVTDERLVLELGLSLGAERK